AGAGGRRAWRTRNTGSPGSREGSERRRNGSPGDRPRTRCASSSRDRSSSSAGTRPRKPTSLERGAWITRNFKKGGEGLLRQTDEDRSRFNAQSGSRRATPPNRNESRPDQRPND